MKYNIVTISDIHWGVINPDIQKDSLKFFMKFLELYGDKIDLAVFAGDYWESKLSLNSRDAITGIKWFHKVYELCAEKKIAIRMFQGTLDHDNDQLEVFKPLTGDIQDIEKCDAYYKIFTDKGKDPKPFFDIFMETTVEETLPDLVCCYCPDETIKTDEYEELYINQILQMKDIGFFHGSFDLVYGDLLEAKEDEFFAKNNVIYRYDLWAPQIKGPLISGHWHDGKQYSELYYIGSPFRWKFREDEDKGFLFIQYDTEDNTYFIKKITNPLSAKYLTYEIYTNTFEDKDDYVKILKDVENILEQLKDSITDDKLRIMFYIVDEKDINEIFLSALRQEIVKYKNCKITIKDKLKHKKKMETEKKAKEDKKQVGFIFEENVKPSNKIHDYIMKSSNDEVDVPMDFINKKIDQYL